MLKGWTIGTMWLTLGMLLSLPMLTTGQCIGLPDTGFSRIFPRNEYTKTRRYYRYCQNLTMVPTDIPSQASIVLISGNPITEVHSNTFRNLSHCVHLDLCCNTLHTLHPGAFLGLSRVKQLNLNHNKVRFLEWGVFTGLHLINTLVLNDNALVNLPWTVFLPGDYPDTRGHPARLQLRVSGNPVVCSTDMCWIRQGETDGWITWQAGSMYQPECINFNTTWQEITLKCGEHPNCKSYIIAECTIQCELAGGTNKTIEVHLNQSGCPWINFCSCPVCPLDITICDGICRQLGKPVVTHNCTMCCCAEKQCFSSPIEANLKSVEGEEAPLNLSFPDDQKYFSTQTPNVESTSFTDLWTSDANVQEYIAEQYSEQDLPIFHVGIAVFAGTVTIILVTAIACFVKSGCCTQHNNKALSKTKSCDKTNSCQIEMLKI